MRIKVVSSRIMRSSYLRRTDLARPSSGDFVTYAPKIRCGHFLFTGRISLCGRSVSADPLRFDTYMIEVQTTHTGTAKQSSRGPTARLTQTGLHLSCSLQGNYLGLVVKVPESIM